MRHSRAALSMFVLLVGFLVQPAGLGSIRADTLPLVRDVEFQPLSAQARRVVDALDMLGQPLPRADREMMDRAIAGADQASGARAQSRRFWTGTA